MKNNFFVLKYKNYLILLLLLCLVCFSVFLVGRRNVLKDKIGQMVVVGFRGTEANDNSYITKVIKDLRIGGVILFDYDVPSKSSPRNITSPEQTSKLITDLKGYATVPMLISIDAEGGKVNRLKPKYGFMQIMSPKQMGNSSLEIVKGEAGKLSYELKTLGFNMNFAPVLDVDINPKNPVIGGLERSFSSDLNKVIENARAFIQVQKENGIISVVKHFPGHGSSEGDSHLGLVDVTKTYKEKELIPYQELQKEGSLEAVMTAHIINTKIDNNYPATLSPLFLQNILRNKIGFQGVVISDDMQMNAIASNYGFEDAVIRAVNAGCDILVLSNNSTAVYDEKLPYKTVDVIYKAVKEGVISKERIDQSYERILNLKKEYNVIK